MILFLFYLILCRCFLRTDTHFIWAYIGPVILMFIANIGFFIMAASITWRHQMKDNKSLQNVRTWLKSAVSLTVIMGLTWIPGLFVVGNEGVLPLAYISTILVASQGIFIFLIFVLFSKNVRDTYLKWWKVKVNESDTLSKYFGKSLTSGMVRESYNQYTRWKFSLFQVA